MPRIEAEGALRLLGQLSMPLRETLWLREVGGLSYAEIAEVQAVSRGRSCPVSTPPASGSPATCPRRDRQPAVMHRRHPSPLELGAYFDGETIEGVSEHVARCRKCRESLDELRGVRCAVRGELDLTDGSARRRARWTVALIPVAASVALLLAMAAPPGGLPVTRVENADQTPSRPAAPPLFMPADTADLTPASGAVGGRRPVACRPAPLRLRRGRCRGSAADGGTRGLAGAGAGCRRRVPRPPRRAGGQDGRRAVDVDGRLRARRASGSAGQPGRSASGSRCPTRGSLAGEGNEVLRAVRAVADRANDAGGVAGRHVEVVAVPTDDDAGPGRRPRPGRGARRRVRHRRPRRDALGHAGRCRPDRAPTSRPPNWPPSRPGRPSPPISPPVAASGTVGRRRGAGPGRRPRHRAGEVAARPLGRGRRQHELQPGDGRSPQA